MGHGSFLLNTLEGPSLIQKSNLFESRISQPFSLTAFSECSPHLAKFKRFSEDFYCEMPKKFSKFHVPGTEMMFIADEKLISTVFRHVMFCVTQAVTS